MRGPPREWLKSRVSCQRGVERSGGVGGGLPLRHPSCWGPRHSRMSKNPACGLQTPQAIPVPGRHGHWWVGGDSVVSPIKQN